MTRNGTGPLGQRAAMMWGFSAFRMFLPFWFYAMISLLAVVIAPGHVPGMVCGALRNL